MFLRPIRSAGAAFVERNRQWIRWKHVKVLLERAVGFDPNYSLAWSGLADARAMFGLYGFRHPGAVMPKAKEAANRAIGK